MTYPSLFLRPRLGFWFLMASALWLVACQGPPPPPTPIPQPLPTPGPPISPEQMELGINNVNDPRDCPAGGCLAVNNSLARGLGATWTRWPAEWFLVEQPTRFGRGNFRWAENYSDRQGNDIDFDILAAATTDNYERTALNTLAVLNGIPRIYDCIHNYAPPLYNPPNPYPGPDHHDQYTECYINHPSYPRIMGLFLDSTNEENRWANYAYQTGEKRHSREGYRHWPGDGFPLRLPPQLSPLPLASFWGGGRVFLG